MLVAAGLVSACAMRSRRAQSARARCSSCSCPIRTPATSAASSSRIPQDRPNWPRPWRIDPRRHDAGARGSAPLSESDVKRRFGDVLATLPPPPRHFVLLLPVRVRGADRRKPASRAGGSAGGQEPARSRRRRHRPHRHDRHAGSERRARAAARQRGAHAPRRRRAEPVGDRGRARTARPSCSCRPPTTSSSRATAASKSRCDDPALAARGGWFCCAGCCPRLLVALLSLVPPAVVHAASSTASTTRWCARSRRARRAAAIVIVDVDERAWRDRPVAVAPRRHRQADRAAARSRRRRRSRSTSCSPSRIATEATASTPDAALAETLRAGRVVLGYAMTFDGDAPRRRAPACSIRSACRRQPPDEQARRAVLPRDRRRLQPRDA